MLVSHRYAAHGTEIQSDLPLPEFPIRIAPLGGDCLQIAADASLPLPDFVGERYGVHEPGFRVAWDEVGTFQITLEGNIRYRRVPAASDELIRVPLLGSILAVALHFRNTLVMHGNAMFVDGKAAILVGAKGRGKSTLSAAMLNRGHRVYAEDTASVEMPAGAPVVALPGTRQLRLWPDSLERLLGGSGLESRPMHELSDKRVVPLPNLPELPARVSLKRIYVIEEATDLSLQPVPSAEAWQQVLTHSFVSRFGSELLAGPRAARHFAACSALAKGVPCVRLQRPRDFSRLGETVEHIEKDLASA